MDQTIEKQFNKYFLPINKFRLASSLEMLRKDLQNIATLNALKLEERQAQALKAITKKIQDRVDNFDVNYNKLKPPKNKTKPKTMLKNNRLSTLLKAFITELNKQGLKIQL